MKIPIFYYDRFGEFVLCVYRPPFDESVGLICSLQQVAK